MSQFFTRRKLSTAIFLLSQPFITFSVFAAGFQINEISPALQGDATAGSAAANNDVSAMLINPATLASLKRNQIYIGASEILPRIDMSDASAIHTINIPGDPPSNISAEVLGEDSQGNISQGAFVPTAYFGIRINPCLVAGLSITAPFGLKTHYDNDSVVRFAADYSAVQTVNIAPAIAWSFNQYWDVGVGFQAQFMKATFSNYNGAYTGISEVDAFIASTQPTLLDAHGWGYGFTLGAVFKPFPSTRIGLGFRSQISEQLRGNGDQFVVPGDISLAPSQEFPSNAHTSVSGAIKTPAVLNLSAAHDYYRWTFKGTVQMNFWQTFNQISINMPDAFATNSTIPTHWQNTWFAALGAEYRITPCITLRGGVAYDETPTRDEYRDPRIPDSDRYWANLGATWKLNECWSFDAAYSHIFMNGQTVDVTQLSGTNPIATIPLEENEVYAKYHGHADVVALAVRFSF